MRGLIILQLFLAGVLMANFSVPGIAAERIKTKPTRSGPSEILRISKAGCEEMLRPLADPEALIMDGLKALSAAGDGAPTLQSCLDETVIKWESFNPALSPFGKRSYRSLVSAAADELTVIEKKIQCVLPADTGIAVQESFRKLKGDSCVSTFLPNSALEKLNADREDAKRRKRHLENEISIRELLPSLIRQLDLFPPALEPDRTNRNLNYDRVEAFAQAIEASESEPVPNINSAEAISTLVRYYCASSVSADALEFCSEKGIANKIDYGAAVSAKSYFANAKEVADAWIARKKNIESKQPLFLTERNEKYALRRLLARYRAYSAKHGTTVESIAEFCAGNERTQELEAKLSLIRPVVPFKEEDWKKVVESGWSELGASIVYDYTASSFGPINRALWNSKKKVDAIPIPEEVALQIEVLNDALATAVPYTAGPVRRRSTLPKEVLDEHQVGEIVTYDAFTSTSKDPAWPENQSSHVFVIYPGKKAANVQSVSTFPHEQEVLFQAGTRFKVLSRTPRGTTETFEFVMAEVDEAGNVIAKLPEKP